MIRLLSCFSGIGAYEKGLQNLGIDYELVNYCEIDEQASKSYAAIHNVDESLNLGDITKVNEKELPKDIDLLTYSFPCTDISLAGKQQGLFNEDGTLTRSGLFFDALRIIKEVQPKVAIAENVKNLTSKKFKDQFELILDSLEQVGYNNYWQVLNAKDYGIPQNRERVFIVSIRKDVDNGEFKFPDPFPLELRLRDMLEDEVDEKYYLSDTQVNSIKTSSYTQNQRRIQEKDWCDTLCARDWKDPKCVPVRIGGLFDTEESKHQAGSIWDKNNISPTLDTMQGGYRQPLVTIEEPKVINPLKDKTEYGWHFEQNVYDSNGITRALKAGGGSGNIPKVFEPKIQKIDIPQTVKVRKYEVDVEKLCSVLRDAKQETKISNNELALELNVPQTKVEHWFRQDKHFAIPDEDIWFRLKDVLNIKTDEFDKAIMTFEEKEGVYEKSERHYFTDGIAPTLTSSSAGNEKFIVESSDVNE